MRTKNFQSNRLYYFFYKINNVAIELREFCKLRIPVYQQTQIHPIQLELFKNSKNQTNTQRKKP
jgi:hypothetical protein